MSPNNSKIEPRVSSASTLSSGSSLSARDLSAFALCRRKDLAAGCTTFQAAHVNASTYVTSQEGFISRQQTRSAAHVSTCRTESQGRKAGDKQPRFLPSSSKSPTIVYEVWHSKRLVVTICLHFAEGCQMLLCKETGRVAMRFCSLGLE